MAAERPQGWSARRPLVEAAVWLLLVAVAWYLSAGYDREVQSYAWGTVGWPRAILLIVLVCAAAAFVDDLRRVGRQEPATGAEDDGPGSVARTRIALTFVLPLLYLWLLPRTGYFVTTPFFLAAYMATLGQRRAIHLVGTNLLIFAIMIALFSKMLFVPLPTGNWPGFYDASNLILVWLAAL